MTIDQQHPLLRTDVGDFEMLVDSDPVAADSLLVDLFTNASGSGSFELVSPSVELSLQKSSGRLIRPA